MSYILIYSFAYWYVVAFFGAVLTTALFCYGMPIIGSISAIALVLFLALRVILNDTNIQ